MDIYNITGMSCAACSARVENAVSELKGVDQCSVNLLTNSMTVNGDASPKAIIKAVEKAGYGAVLKDESQNNNLEDTVTPVLKKRFVVSMIFLVVLMYFSMFHTMWHFPLPQFLSNSPFTVSVIQLIFTVIIMILNRNFFINGFKGIIHKAPNMDTLVSIGSAAGFIYSIVSVIKIAAAQFGGNLNLAKDNLHDLYFESSAMILVLITLGKLLEAKAKGKTTNALKKLLELSPKTATLIIDGKETEVPAESVVVGDIFIVKPGQSIAVDGIVIDGFSAIDESMLSGESIPVEKQIGDTVSSGTINQSGFLKCRATAVGNDTAISQIIKMVSDAASTKAPIAKIADKVSGYFVPTVIIIGLITTIIWLLIGQSVGFALSRGISVLVISCPCALGLATPVAIMVASGKGAKSGILFKNAIALEKIGKSKIICFDKTGTITNGKPVVTDIIPFNISKQELLTLAFSLEKQSEHPLSKAIINECERLGIKYNTIENFKAVAGNGLSASCENNILKGGNLSFMDGCVPNSEIEKATQLANNGKTPLFFSKNNDFCGIIAVADTPKPESRNAIKELKNMGLRVIMISGDNENTVRALGKNIGIDEIFANTKPNEKANIVSKLKHQAGVIMVGDGINDAPALTCADVGIAIGTGTDIAIDSADIVLMKNNLFDVCAAIRLSRHTINNIHQNLFWAFCYNCFGIPLAAGVFISLFGWQLNPMFSAAAMSLSSFCVVSNALRLNFAKIHDNKKDKKIKQKEKSKLNIKTTLKIEGMMCPHCEARVKSALEDLKGTVSVVVSHKDGTAIVESKKDITKQLKQTVESAGYKVLEIL